MHDMANTVDVPLNQVPYEKLHPGSGGASPKILKRLRVSRDSRSAALARHWWRCCSRSACGHAARPGATAGWTRMASSTSPASEAPARACRPRRIDITASDSSKRSTTGRRAVGGQRSRQRSSPAPTARLAASRSPSANSCSVSLQTRECVIALEALDGKTSRHRSLPSATRDHGGCKQTAELNCSQDPARRRQQEAMAAKLRVANGPACVEARNQLADMMAPGARGAARAAAGAAGVRRRALHVAGAVQRDLGLTDLRMRTDDRWLVIVNPASGRPDGGAAWRAIEQALRRAGVRLRRRSTRASAPRRRAVRSHGRCGRTRHIARGRRRRLGERRRSRHHGPPGLADDARGDAGRGARRHRQRLGPLAGHPRDPAGIARCDRARPDGAARRRRHRLSRGQRAARRWFINVAGAGYDAVRHANGCRDRCRPRSLTSSGALRRSRAATAHHGSRSPPTATHDRRPAAARLRRQRAVLRQPHARRAHGTHAMTDMLDVLAVQRAVAAAGVAEAREALSPDGSSATRRCSTCARRACASKPIRRRVIQADGQIVGETPAEFSVAAAGVARIVP
ncbi:MAG: hypothetical protein MZV70_33750 [Desulfobacterales bacterium]|nr:hypothetical protein [Desulfobacterales bacterium]